MTVPEGPRILIQLFQSRDDAMVRRLTSALSGMVKLDGPALERAALG